MASERNGRVLQFMGSACLDKDIALEALRQGGRGFRRLSEDLRADKDVAMVAVSANGEMLQHASKELRGDPDIVLAAVQQNGKALQFATLGLKKSHDIAFAAVRQNGYALKYCSAALQGHRDFSAESHHARFDKQALGGLVAYYQSLKEKDREVVFEACKNYGLALEWTSTKNQMDREIVMAAVTQNGRALRFAHASLRGNRDIVASALAQENCGSEIFFASDELRADPDIVTLAAAYDFKEALAHAADSMKRNFRTSGILFKALSTLEPAAVGSEPQKIPNNVQTNSVYKCSLETL